MPAIISRAPQNEESTSNQKPFWITPISAAMGGASAGSGFFIFEGLKKKVQSGQQISWHPRELMRGSCSFATSVGTTAIVQISIDQKIKSINGFHTDSKLHNAGAAAVSGAIGGMFSTFVENTILAQQLGKCGPLVAVNSMFKEGVKRPFVGIAPLMCRELGFGLTMLFGAPEAGKYAAENFGEKARKPGEIAAGIVGAYATQPFDTAATDMQKKGLTTWQAAKNVVQNKRYFTAGGWRAALFTGCALTIPPATKKAEELLEMGVEASTKPTGPKR